MDVISNVPEPSGYRDAAAALRRRAEDLSYYAQRVDRTVSATEFEGPAANRFQATMTDQRSAVLRLSGELQTYANAMSQAATRYEAMRAADGIL